MGCVYLAKNRVNGKRYVGKTIGPLEKRMVYHLLAAKHKANTTLFTRALAKHGAAAFEWIVLFEGDNDSELLRVEREMIAMLRTRSPKGYNLTDGGEGPCGCKRSEETRRKMSEASQNRKRAPLSPDHRAKIGAAIKGKRHSEETKEKMRLAIANRSVEDRARIGDAIRDANNRRSPEVLAKIANAHRGMKRSPEARLKMSMAGRGKHISAEHRAKLSRALKGRKCPPRSPEHRENQRKAQTGLKHVAFSAEHRERLSIVGRKRWAKIKEEA